MRKGDHVNAIAEISHHGGGNNFPFHLCKFNESMTLNLLGKNEKCRFTLVEAPCLEFVFAPDDENIQFK